MEKILQNIVLLSNYSVNLIKINCEKFIDLFLFEIGTANPK